MKNCSSALRTFTSIHLYPSKFFRTHDTGESLNISYLSPYLESLGSNFTNGANFAVAGATALQKFNPFNLIVQVLQFLRFRERSLLLISKGFTCLHNNTNIICSPRTLKSFHDITFAGHSNLVSEEEFRNALYIIDIGQNDLFTEFIDLSYEQVIQNISTSIAVIDSAVRVKHNSHCLLFLVHLSNMGFGA